MRLDRFLAARMPSWSRAQLQALLERGAARVGAVTAKKSSRVTQGNEVLVESTERPAGRGSTLVPEPMDLDVLYEDELVLAVNKPAGLVVHPGSGNRTGTLVNGLLHRAGGLSGGSAPDRPGIVHRLDKDTSGVLLVARTDQAHAALAAQFSARRVHKTYYGFCTGSCPLERGTIDKPIARSRRDPTRFCVHCSGRASVTEFVREAWEGGVGFVAFRPHTGRTHQIRVHASSAGMPIVADTVYGGGREAVLRLEPLERAFAYQLHKCFERQALHAYAVTFEHPSTGRAMRLAAPFPPDFARAIALFGERIPRTTFESVRDEGARS